MPFLYDNGVHSAPSQLRFHRVLHLLEVYPNLWISSDIRSAQVAGDLKPIANFKVGIWVRTEVSPKVRTWNLVLVHKWSNKCGMFPLCFPPGIVTVYIRTSKLREVLGINKHSVI